MLPDPLKDEIKLLIQDLEGACTFLLDLSRAEAPRTMVKLWRNEVLELSYDLEDYIDKTTDPYYNQFEVEEFRILVVLARDACKSYHRYHLGRLWPSNPSFIAGGHGRVPFLNREETYLVGIDDARHKLISLLMDKTEQGLKVVPIHGPAGVGKTTLAQEVYREIGGAFDCRAFVRASRMPDTRRLLWSIISQIQRHQRLPYDCTVQRLVDSLREYLQHKRYLVIIDGLWERTSWDIISSAFPSGTYCSRILITTEIEEVALECSDYQSDTIFLMEPLSRDYSAELLNSRVSCYNLELLEQLKENLEDIIRTCCGLPLAIISIANMLARQPDNPELWCQVKECLSSRLRNNLTSEGVLREIVGLSYDCLSHDLKICLLYLSMYPEGYTFLKADLLKQWMAEGFISAVQENANEAAESYFDELVCRGLIQPNHTNFSDRMVSYTLHSTMFEVIRYKSIEENFTTVIDYSNALPELSAKVRRLSLRYSNAKYATKPDGITLSPVRSLIFYGLVECLPSVSEFVVLRVLNLEFWGDKKEFDLSGINQLFQLRYVRITTDIVVKLPAKISGLQYLETLEIYARVATIPSDIVHLPRLLHLCLHDEINLSDGIEQLNLQEFTVNIGAAPGAEESDETAAESERIRALDRPSPWRMVQAVPTTTGGGIRAILTAGNQGFLIRNSGEQVKISSIEASSVALYFSASWCPPCRVFTPMLIEAYKERASQGKRLEVVFVSGDQDEEAFNAYFAKMPWLAVPFSDSEGRKGLECRFKVSAIPHLVILDAKTSEVYTEDGVEFVSKYGVQAYPFTPERINELKEQEKAAKDNQTIQRVLGTSIRDYLISNKGDKVPISELEGKYVGLCFVVNGYGPVDEFTAVLAKIYEKLKEVGEKFEIVAVSLDSDESSYNESFAKMLWLAIPHGDKMCEKLVRYFELKCLATLVLIGPDGKTLNNNVADIIEEHGFEAWEGFPFGADKLETLVEKAKAKEASQTLESLLICGNLDFVIGKDGAKVSVSELVGETVLLYFSNLSEKWCEPCRAFLPTLVKEYNKIKENNSAFEIVFISFDRDQSSFDKFFSEMPWLALPFEDERKTFLKKALRIHGIPSLIAIGPTGQTVSRDAKSLLMIHGADAFPFTMERFEELQNKLDEMAKGWPEKLKHELHEEHEVVLLHQGMYGCDGCEELGRTWSYRCDKCDFDLHPKCALAQEERRVRRTEGRLGSPG